MLEHLDDERTFEPDLSFHEHVMHEAGRRRRRRRVAVLSVAMCPILLAAGLVVYLRGQAGELEHVHVGGLTNPADSPTVTVDPASPDAGQTGESVPAPPSTAPPITAPINVLVVGVDQRAPDDAATSGVTGSRADSLAVVRIDPASGRLAVLSLPRDLWVEANGRANRINSFLAEDRTTLVGVVSELLAIEINHYVEIDFAGFQRLVDLAGGVNIPFDAALRDTHTGFLAEPGCQHLDGTMALAYARSRHMQRFDDATGKWTEDPTSDFGRIERQQDLASRIVGVVLTADYGRVDEVHLLTDVVDDITVDDGLNLDSLRSLFTTARIIGPGGISTFTLSDAVRGTVIKGNSVLVADSPDAIAAIVNDFMGANTEVPTTAPTPAAETSNTVRPAAEVC